MTIKCPCCNSEEFSIETIEKHTWSVNKNGEWVEELSYDDSYENPDAHYTCLNCDHEAIEQNDKFQAIHYNPYLRIDQTMEFPSLLEAKAWIGEKIGWHIVEPESV